MRKWIEENGKYFYEDDGIRLRGFQYDENNKKYYLDMKDGHMVIGWFQVTDSNDWHYAFENQVAINGEQYYRGQVAENVIILLPGGTYSFDMSGVATPVN